MKKLIVVLSFLTVLAVSIAVFAEDINLTTIMPTILRAKKGAIGNTFFSSVTLPNADIPASSLLVEGRVGIGTTAPSYKLDVQAGSSSVGMGVDVIGDASQPFASGTPAGEMFLTRSGGVAMALGLVGGGTPYGYLQVGHKTAAGNYYSLSLNPNGGNVGIGMINPGSALTVMGSIETQNSLATNPLLLYTTRPGNYGGNQIALGFRDEGSLTDNDEIWIGPNRAIGAPVGHIQLLAKYIDISTGATGYAKINGNNILTSSDITLKKDIVTIPNALDRVYALRGVNFRWKDKDSQSLHMGVIGQEVEKVFPEVITTDEHGKKYVAYESLVGALIEAIKAQQKEIEALKADVAKLKSR